MDYFCVFYTIFSAFYIVLVRLIYIMIVAMHIFYRILAFIGLLIVAVVTAMSLLNPDRTCGTGDSLPLLFFSLIAYVIWTMYLIIEAFLLHKKKAYGKRNANLILSLVAPFIAILIIKILYELY